MCRNTMSDHFLFETRSHSHCHPSWPWTSKQLRLQVPPSQAISFGLRYCSRTQIDRDSKHKTKIPVPRKLRIRTTQAILLTLTFPTRKIHTWSAEISTRPALAMSEYPIIMFLKQGHHIRHTRAHKEDDCLEPARHASTGQEWSVRRLSNTLNTLEWMWRPFSTCLDGDSRSLKD